MGSGEDWLPVAEQLSQNFYCLLPDLPGHGDTPLDASPGYETWSAALKGVLLDLEIERACLVGYSLGGRLALYFSLSYPEMVSQLVLESANPGISDPLERQQRATRDADLSARILEEGLDSFLSTWYDLPLFSSLEHHSDLKAELCQQRAQQSPQSMAAVLQALGPGLQPDLSARLPEIQVPTLLIAGHLDHKYTRIIHEMNQVIPNSQMFLLEGCGHNVHRECPARYLEELWRWLD
jgi:2-succinyl-6-hydroxy-2,4-cyclohexadiene-1-carboxylate synthase